MQQERSSHRVEPNRYIGRFERLPYNTIEAVIFNDEMSDSVVDKQVGRWLTDVDYAISHAGIFSLGRIDGGTPRLQAPTMHRAVILAISSNPFVAEDDVCYEKVVAKGTGYSWANGGIKLSQSDPLGLFGEADARRDMEISNTFARHGGRTARGLCILVINHARFQEWYESMGENQNTYDVKKQLNIVDHNNDTMAIYVRLMGAERIAEYRAAEDQGYYAQVEMEKRATNLLRREIDMRGTNDFIRKYRLEEFKYTPIDVRRILTYPAFSTELLFFLSMYFYYFNRGVVNVISKTRYDNKLNMPFETQNNDLAGLVYDWENTFRPMPSGIMPGIGVAVAGAENFYNYDIPALCRTHIDEIKEIAKINGEQVAWSRVT